MNHITELRRRWALSQRQFAERLGVAQTTISAWERMQEQELPPLARRVLLDNAVAPVTVAQEDDMRKRLLVAESYLQQALDAIRGMG